MAVGSAFALDASIGAAWLLPDESTELTEAALHATATHDVWVPSLWPLEMSNLLLNAQRRRRIGADKRAELAARASSLRVRIDREAVSIATLDELASRHALTAYDAAYLELAQRRGLPLATRDEALLAAMAAGNVQPVTMNMLTASSGPGRPRRKP